MGYVIPSYITDEEQIELQLNIEQNEIKIC